jgi:hypothetical protein
MSAIANRTAKPTIVCDEDTDDTRKNAASASNASKHLFFKDTVVRRTALDLTSPQSLKQSDSLAENEPSKLEALQGIMTRQMSVIV